MKMSIEGIEKYGAITEHIGGGGTAGLGYETTAELEGVEQLDKLDDANALILARVDSGSLDLKTILLP